VPSRRSYRNADILAIAARTCAADHTPPRGAEIPRTFNSFAIERSEAAPAIRMSSITGAKSAARDFAAKDLARRALAQSAAVPARPRKPPSPHLALVAPETCEAHGGAEFPGLGLLLAGDRARLKRASAFSGSER
jgi:hypothetical protein